MLNVRELVTGRSSMLKEVVRFNNAHRRKDESVAEHSFYVTFYALLFASHVERRDAKNLFPICYRTLFSRCLVHDLEESLSGDFPRNFKYSVLEVKEGLDRAAAIAFQQVIEPLFAVSAFHTGNDEQERQKDWLERDELVTQWLHAKADDAEGRIVALADILSTIQYIWLEVQTGNHQILVDVSDLPGNVNEICEDSSNLSLFGSELLYDIRKLTGDLYEQANPWPPAADG